MPERHFIAPNASIEPNDPASPARNLLAAVLIRALMDSLNKPDTEEQSKTSYFVTWKRKAEAWFRSNEVIGPTKERPNTGMSFCWICENLEIEPIKVRQFIREAKKGNQRFEPGMYRPVEAWEVESVKQKKTAHF